MDTLKKNNTGLQPNELLPQGAVKRLVQIQGVAKPFQDMSEEQMMERAEMYCEKMLSATTQEDANMYRQLMNRLLNKLNIRTTPYEKQL